MKKRLICALLCVVMLMSVVPMTAIAEEATGFTDVEENAWYTEPVYYCVENGYFAGTSETAFSPEASMTRAMFVTVLSKYADGDIGVYDQPSFTDVEKGSWYYNATEWAAEAGYVAGIGNGLFGPNNTITHQEIIAVLYALVKAQGYDVTPREDYRYGRCTDLGEIADWAKDAMDWAAGLGLLLHNGNDGDTPLAAPKAAATRANLAYILYTLDDALTAKPLPTFTISGNDISLYTIVTPENPAEPVKNAAKRFTDWTRNAYGVELTTVTDATEPAEYEILIGQTNREEMGLVTVERDLEKDLGYTISVQGNTLVIAGNVDIKSRRGSLYAVFDLFDDHLGYDFLSDDMIIFDGQPHALEDGFTMSGAPGFESRVVYLNNGWDDIYNNDEDYHRGMYGVHMLPQIIDPSIDSYTAARLPNPCMTDEDNINTVIERVINDLSRDPDNRMVWLTQPDTGDYCTCDECMAIMNDNDGRPSAPIYYFCNRVYEGIAEAGYEDTLILTLAYLYSKRPPTNMEPNDHIVVYYCPIDNCIFCPYNDETCPINSMMKEDIEIWSELCNKIYVWDYSNNFIYYLNAYPNYDNMLINNNWFYEMGVRGAFNNGESGFKSEFADLRAFLLSELYMEPTMSEEKYYDIMYTYLENYFGPGWHSILEYMNITLEFSENYHYHCNFPAPSGANLLQYAVNKGRINALWDEAEALAANDWQLNNIRRSRISATYMVQSGSWFSEYLLGTPEQRENWMMENEELWADINYYEIELENHNNPIKFSREKRPCDW